MRLDRKWNNEERIKSETGYDRNVEARINDEKNKEEQCTKRNNPGDEESNGDLEKFLGDTLALI